MCLWGRGDSGRPSCTLAWCHRSSSSISKTTGMTQSNEKKNPKKPQNPTRLEQFMWAIYQMTFEIAHRSQHFIRHSGSAGAQELCRCIFSNITLLMLSNLWSLLVELLHGGGKLLHISLPVDVAEGHIGGLLLLLLLQKTGVCVWAGKTNREEDLGASSKCKNLAELDILMMNGVLVCFFFPIPFYSDLGLASSHLRYSFPPGLLVNLWQ